MEPKRIAGNVDLQSLRILRCAGGKGPTTAHQTPRTLGAFNSAVMVRATATVFTCEPAVMFTVAVYVPDEKLAAALSAEIIRLPGFPGLVLPAVADNATQLAGAADGYCTLTP